MTIQEAFKKKKSNQAVGSLYANMHLQTKKSFVHWLLLDKHTSNEEKILRLKRILSATDWKVEDKGRDK